MQILLKNSYEEPYKKNEFYSEISPLQPLRTRELAERNSPRGVSEKPADSDEESQEQIKKSPARFDMKEDVDESSSSSSSDSSSSEGIRIFTPQKETKNESQGTLPLPASVPRRKKRSCCTVQ